MLLNFTISMLSLVIASIMVAAEFALVRIRKSQLIEEEKKKPNSKTIKQSIHMTENLNEYLSTTQVGITITGLIVGWVGEKFMSELIIGIFETIFHLNITSTTSHVVASIISLLLLTFFEVVFTELLPKNIAINSPLKTMNFITKPVMFLHTLFFPLVFILNTSANFFIKLMGMNVLDEEENVVSQSELVQMASASVISDKSEIDETDVELLRRALELNEKTVDDVLIHRTKIVSVDNDFSVEQALNKYYETGHTRLLVTKNEQKDNIIGYVTSKTLFKEFTKDNNKLISEIDSIDKLLCFQSGTLLMDAVKEMRTKNTPIALVVDEYGGTEGIVTDKDILDELLIINDEKD